MPLSDADISFIVQGPIISPAAKTAQNYTTNEVLESIRKHFPKSQIVLSTWKGAETAHLDYDSLVLNDDPGPLNLNGIDYNINRLIRSTVNGLSNCINDYVVKTRTDVIFTSNALLSEMISIEPVNSRYKLFQNKVLSTNFYVRDPVKSNILYHPSDILLIGTKSDIGLLFNHELATYNEFNRAGEAGGFDNRIVNEQYLLLKTIKKVHNTDIPYTAFWEYKGIKNLIRSENFIFKNFSIHTARQLGISLPKRLTSSDPESNYSARALKWFPIIKSTIVSDFLFFTIIRGCIYYFKNQTISTRLRNAFNNRLHRLKWR